MPSDLKQRAFVQELLNGFSDLELREFCIEALKLWHKDTPDPLHFSVHGDLGPKLVAVIEQRRPLPSGNIDSIKEVFLDCASHAWMTPIVEFTYWFVRAGFAAPLSSTANAYPITLRLTRYGLRFLTQTGDHPLLPNSVERLRTRCPALPDDVLGLLVDARTCMDHMLLRPALVLMGVAYELAVDQILSSLVKRSLAQDAVLDQRAAKRIVTVKNVAETLPSASDGERERRFAVLAACEFADTLRRRRNDAAHTKPTYGFDDRGETEELVISATRHLPALWSLAN